MNIPTRYLIDEVCLAAEIHGFYGSIHQFEGQGFCFQFQ